MAQSASSLSSAGPPHECLLSLGWSTQLCGAQSALYARPYFLRAPSGFTRSTTLIIYYMSECCSGHVVVSGTMGTYSGKGSPLSLGSLLARRSEVAAMVRRESPSD